MKVKDYFSLQFFSTLFLSFMHNSIILESRILHDLHALHFRPDCCAFAVFHARETFLDVQIACLVTRSADVRFRRIMDQILSIAILYQLRQLSQRTRGERMLILWELITVKIIIGRSRQFFDTSSILNEILLQKGLQIHVR